MYTCNMYVCLHECMACMYKHARICVCNIVSFLQTSLVLGMLPQTLLPTYPLPSLPCSLCCFLVCTGSKPTFLKHWQLCILWLIEKYLTYLPTSFLSSIRPRRYLWAHCYCFRSLLLSICNTISLTTTENCSNYILHFWNHVKVSLDRCR